MRAFHKMTKSLPQSAAAARPTETGPAKLAGGNDGGRAYALTPRGFGQCQAEGRHFDRGRGGVESFVHASFSLLKRVSGQDAEGHRQSGFKRHLLQSARGLASDVIEMRSASA